jgi:hypothetical protein
MPSAKPKKPAAPAKPEQSKKTSPLKEAPEDAPEQTTVTPSAEKVLAALLPDFPQLTASQRSAFAARYADSLCEVWGNRTKSEGVLREALGFASLMAKALKAHPAALRRYSPARFSWFLSCISALIEARALQSAGGSAAAEKKVLLAQAEVRAREARKELLATLSELCDGNDAEEQRLAEAAGTADTPSRVIASITALAAFGRGWVERSDEMGKELVASVGLTLAEVEEAEATAEGLSKAGAEKTLEGRVIPRDTPPVNRAEGRVLLEMKAAMRVFASANERNTDIPKLTPQDATRAVLAPKAPKKQSQPALEAEAKKPVARLRAGGA